MLLHSIVKKVSKPILGTVGPWLAPVRHAKQGLAIFVFHEVTENPSPYSRQCSTHCNESLFRRQLKWIRDRFLVIHPLQLDQGTIPPGSALLTFDDGYKSFRTVALPILEDADLPSIVFLNMDVVEGSPNAYAAIAWHRRGSHQGLGSPSDSLPETYERAVRPLRGLDELAEFRKFQGDYLGEGDLLALDGHPLVAFGSHLSNHWHGPSLRDSQFDEAILTNQHRLDRYRNGMRWLAYPFGVGTHNLDERARGHGVRRMFTGQGRLNPDAAQEVLDRIDLSAEIRNQFLFRWRLSSRTVLHGLRG